jgi:hypothetical protein
MYPGTFRHLQLLALDPYDLALSKLTRNADRDRSDVEYLDTAVPLDVAVLRDRYLREMRPYVHVPAREDLMLELWIEMIVEHVYREKGLVAGAGCRQYRPLCTWWRRDDYKRLPHHHTSISSSARADRARRIGPRRCRTPSSPFPDPMCTARSLSSFGP